MDETLEPLFFVASGYDNGYSVMRGTCPVARFVCEDEAIEYAWHRNHLLNERGTTDIAAPAPASPSGETRVVPVEPKPQDYETIADWGLAMHDYAAKLRSMIIRPKDDHCLLDIKRGTQCALAGYCLSAAPEQPEQAVAWLDCQSQKVRLNPLNTIQATSQTVAMPEIPLYARPAQPEQAVAHVLMPKEATDEIINALEGIGEYDVPSDGKSWQDYQRDVYAMVLRAGNGHPAAALSEDEIREIAQKFCMGSGSLFIQIEQAIREALAKERK